MPTSATFTHRTAAITAAIFRMIVAPVAQNGKRPIAEKERISQIVLHGDAEHEVKHHADPKEGEDVRHIVDDVREFAQIFQHSNENDDDRPYAQQEHHDDFALTEGIERGMEVILHPNGRPKVLDGAVDGSRSTDRQTEQRGIDAPDIVEMDYQEALATEPLDEEEDESCRQTGQENEQPAVGETADKAGYGMVGH